MLCPALKGEQPGQGEKGESDRVVRLVTHRRREVGNYEPADGHHVKREHQDGGTEPPRVDPVATPPRERQRKKEPDVREGDRDTADLLGPEIVGDVRDLDRLREDERKLRGPQQRLEKIDGEVVGEKARGEVHQLALVGPRQLVILPPLERAVEARLVVSHDGETAERQRHAGGERQPPPRALRPRLAPRAPDGHQQQARRQQAGRTGAHRQPQAKARRHHREQRTRAVDRVEAGRGGQQRERDARRDRQLPHHRPLRQREQMRPERQTQDAGGGDQRVTPGKVTPPHRQPEPGGGAEREQAEDQRGLARDHFPAGEHRVGPHQRQRGRGAEIGVILSPIQGDVAQLVGAVLRGIIGIRQRQQLGRGILVEVQLPLPPAPHEQLVVIHVPPVLEPVVRPDHEVKEPAAEQERRRDTHDFPSPDAAGTNQPAGGGDVSAYNRFRRGWGAGGHETRRRRGACLRKPG